MSDPNPEEEFTIHHRMSAAQELLRRGWDTNYDNIRPEHLTDYWRDKESTRLSIGQKKTQAGLSTSIDDYDNYDDTDYEAIAKEMREEEDRQAATPATKLPLPQGEGWGEGTDNSLPPRRGKSLPPAKAGVRMGVTEPVSKALPLSTPENEPASDRIDIIKEFKEAMNKGDERAALRAEAKYRRIDVKPEKNIYDYGPNDPDPTIDYYFEPLSPEQQAKFDEEDRREHGLTEEEIADFSSMPAPRGMSERRYRCIYANKASRRSLATRPSTPTHSTESTRSPPSAAHNLKVPSPFWERARVRVNPYPSSPSMPTPVLPPRML